MPFSPNAIQRIRSSVKWTEGQRANLTGPHNTPIRRATGPILAKITATGTSDGYYQAKQVLADGTDAPGGRIWDGGTETGHLPELYAPNDTKGWYVEAKAAIVSIGQSIDASGNVTWVILEALGTTETPAALGDGTEGGTTADTGTWDQTDQSSNDGLKLWVVSRVVYDDAGDETLYAMMRELTFDSLGHLREVSAETAVTIDTPEDCS